jgi:peptidyl-prolyl cis-trans isomerase SurA
MKLIVPAAVMAAALVAPLQAEIIEQVLVKVNGEIITKTDLEQRQIQALRARVGTEIDPDALKNDETLKKTLAEITPRLLVEAIDEMLLVQLGREKGYRLSDQQFKEIVDNIRKEQSLQDDQRFQQALQQEGMTIDDLRRNIERQMLISRVQQDEVGSKLTITEEEARQFYRARPQQFAEPASVTLREILIEVPAETKAGEAGVNVGADDAAAKQAADARARIAAGEDFAKVAAELSAAPSKANGGLVGPVAIDQLSPALHKLVEGMKPGDVSQPIRTTRGYQLFKLETFKPSAIQPFESVRDVVAERIHAERQRSEVRKFLTRLRGQALIEWKNQELKNAYEQQLAKANVS